MLFQVPDVLSKEEVSEVRRMIESASWVDGKKSAGAQAAQVKNNQELPKDDPLAQKASQKVLEALGRSRVFSMTALPVKVSPPTFNRYESQQTYGAHIDNAIRPLPGGGLIRGDLSGTLFLCGPDEYDGGELTVEDTFGTHQVKLPAGHLVLYPAGSLHRVEPVTRGKRLASFFWVQSMVRDDQERALLLEIELAVQKLNQDNAGNPALVSLTGVYHNLLRRWSDV